YHLSPGHFRRIFKHSVGLSPVEYMNRLRIVKSFAYLQDKDLTIADAGAAVGIHDPNYYSRLFKKTIGYSPRYFKDSAPQTAGHGG
ncbi:MAG: helix-turn-helix transcriptional regulator, partial [Butyricicoccus sp.]